jgi:WD40 repeat protein
MGCFSSTPSETPQPTKKGHSYPASKSKCATPAQKPSAHTFIQKQHPTVVHCVIFSKCNEFLISSSEDALVRMWDLASGILVHHLQGHTAGVLSLAANDKRLISGSKDTTIRLWNIRSPNCLATLRGHTHPVLCVLASHCGTLLYSGGMDGSVNVWDARTHSRMVVLTANYPGIISAVWCLGTTDSGWLACGSESGCTRCVHVQQMQPGTALAKPLSHCELQCHSSAVYSLIGMASSTFASCGKDGFVVLFDCVTGVIFWKTQVCESSVNGLTCTQDGAYILACSTDISVLDCRGGTVLLSTPTETTLTSIDIAHDNLRIAVGSTNSTVALWDIAAAVQPDVVVAHQGTVSCMSFSRDVDNSIVATGSEDTTVGVWHRLSFRALVRLRGHSARVWTVAFSQNGIYLFSGGEDTCICVWDGVKLMSLAQTGSNHQADTASFLLHVFRGHTDTVWGLSSSNFNVLVSCSEDHTLRFWKLSPPKHEITVTHSTGALLCMDCIESAGIVACGTSDAKVLLINSQNASVLESLCRHTKNVWSVKFSLCTTSLISCSEQGEIVVWHWSTHTVLFAHYSHVSVGCVAWLNADQVVFGCCDGTLNIRNVAPTSNFEECNQFVGHTDIVTCICVVSGTILSGSVDTTVRMWPTHLLPKTLTKLYHLSHDQPPAS